MVVFTCNHCGESLQKPKVEKHYQFVCRTSKSLTCVDCLKDFRAEEYAVHTKCITEEERYSAKGTFQNGNVKKGEVKQESFVEMVRSIREKQVNMKPAHKSLFDLISSYNNIPRKKTKFINFITSSTAGRANIRDIEEVWNIIEKYKNEQQSIAKNRIPEDKSVKNENNGNTKRKVIDNHDIEDVPTMKKKKQKNYDDVLKDELKNVKTVITEDITSESQSTKFNFKEKILNILKTKGSISRKKLQKKVLNAYLKTAGESECDSNTIKKFNKKLKKIPNLVISEDTVTLSESISENK